ncbi:MAG: sugar phosphate nucleotidyltransferase [Sulfolobales archaeon]
MLAGGKGVGLEPITNTRPKPLVPILNNKLVERHLINLSRVGVGRVIVVVNYMGDTVREFVNKVTQRTGLDVVYVDQGSPLGTAHAVAKAAPYLSDDEFLVLYSDVYFRDTKLLNDLMRIKSNAIAVAKVTDPSRYGVVVIDGGKVVKIVEKPKQYLGNYVNGGVYKFSKELIKFLEKTEASERGEYELTSTLQSMMDVGIEFNYALIDGWVDIGRPWSLLEANKLELEVIDEQVVRGSVEGNVVIKGPVVIEEGSQVLSGSYIVGPSYIGHGVTVGPNAYIRPYSVILDNSRVGFNVEVKESLVMENTHISHQSYVGDSVVCEGVNLGAGTILANLRFDEKNVKVRVKGVFEDSGRKKLGAFIGGYVRTGVNVSVFPGVKIGAYSWIYPGVVVTEDVPPRSILKHNGVLVSMD